MTETPSKTQIADQIQSLAVLVVDDNQYMRKMIRNLLVNCGIKDIYEANDGIAALDAIRSIAPDVAIIMLTAHGERSRVVEAVRLGVNEFLLKPVSSTALLARLVSILARPREMVKKGDYYGPAPRKMSSYKPETDPALDDVVFI